ncbi:MAG TPA: hypothetical protein VLA53_01695, partial [Nitrosopumilaceae archaeon]|nr:hypothetical protein [Nitrosopumilaceae archaeon]
NEALVSYDRALAIDSNYFNALYNKARLKMTQGDYQFSLDLLERAIISDASCKERAKNAKEFKDLRKDSRFKKITN